MHSDDTRQPLSVHAIALGTVVTVSEAARALRCGRTRVFELLAEGRLVRGQKFGRETVVTIASIEALQAAQTPGAPPRRRRQPTRRGRLADAIRALPVGD